MHDYLISLKAAIDALDALCDRECEYSKKQRNVMCGACHLGSAFDAIEQLPSAQSVEKDINVPCKDTISRQAAIDAVETQIKKWNAVDGEGYHVGLGLRYTDVIDTLTELPSTYPETDSFCTDCKEYDSERHFCPRFDRVIKTTVEEMQIVKCKDCKHWSTTDSNFGVCYATHEDDEIGTYKTLMECFADDYCSWAERREDAKVSD